MQNYVIQYVYYYNPVHVSSNNVLIIRRSNCFNTASGIVFCVSDRPVCRLRRKEGRKEGKKEGMNEGRKEGRKEGESFSTCTPDGHLQRILYQMLY